MLRCSNEDDFSDGMQVFTCEHAATTAASIIYDIHYNGSEPWQRGRDSDIHATKFVAAMCCCSGYQRAVRPLLLNQIFRTLLGVLMVVRGGGTIGARLARLRRRMRA